MDDYGLTPSSAGSSTSTSSPPDQSLSRPLGTTGTRAPRSVASFPSHPRSEKPVGAENAIRSP